MSRPADYLLIAIASFLLAAVNWLAFHDFREPHTGRDWLMLFASILVLVHFARILWSWYRSRPKDAVWS